MKITRVLQVYPGVLDRAWEWRGGEIFTRLAQHISPHGLESQKNMH